MYFAAKNKENMTEVTFFFSGWVPCNFLESFWENLINPLKKKFTLFLSFDYMQIGYFFEVAYPKIVFLTLKMLVKNKMW